MTTLIARELRRAFALASLRKEAEAIRTPEGWAEVNAIKERSRSLTEQESRLYRERYATRVEAARKRIIDEAGTPGLVHKPAFAGFDRFDAEQTLRQAQRQVRDAHDRRLARIEHGEFQALSGLVESSRVQNLGSGALEPGTYPRPDRSRAVASSTPKLSQSARGADFACHL